MEGREGREEGGGGDRSGTGLGDGREIGTLERAEGETVTSTRERAVGETVTGIRKWAEGETAGRLVHERES